MKKLTIIASALLFCFILSSCTNNSDYVYGTSNYTSSQDTAVASATPVHPVRNVPWDYRVVEEEVGDLVGSDMTIIPDNTLLPNDGNYATGDKVWILQYMDAMLTTDDDRRSQIKLSSWDTLKSFKDEKSALADLGSLKESIQTEVDLIGVYKTENAGKTREFAVLALPSGNVVKQPISDEKYAQLKSKSKVKVTIEQVHLYDNYDQVYSKFRGWAQ
ncbi:signal peptide protein [Paenibacillus sp. MMO-177]|uniref:signal peptide protein n=1 Tax=Paenibacillus sp. MMO-177 TaxID=3081289 RepID=UPI00301916DB